MAKSVTGASGSAAAHSLADPVFDLPETFHLLNQKFGEVVDGRVFGSDDYITDPDELSRFPRPTDEEIRQQVCQGFANHPLGKKS